MTNENAPNVPHQPSISELEQFFSDPSQAHDLGITEEELYQIESDRRLRGGAYLKAYSPKSTPVERAEGLQWLMPEVANDDLWADRELERLKEAA